MIARAAGILLTLFSAGGMGLWYTWKWMGRLRTLERLRRMVYVLKGEITYRKAPLADGLEQAGRREGDALGALFLRMAERIRKREGESLDVIWREETAQLDGQAEGQLLTAEDRTLLGGLGGQLGYLDAELQERILLLYLEQLDEAIAYLRAHRREQCRLYASLGVVGGMFLVIAMC